MVVIVIRAQSKDSGEEIYSSRSGYPIENPPPVFASNRIRETCDETDCFNESWPSSHAFGLNTNLEGRDFVNLNRTLHNITSDRNHWEADEERFTGRLEICYKAHSAEQNACENRLESPVSKDSGFCDRTTTPCKKKRINCYRVPETRECLTRQNRLPSSAMLPESNRLNPQNNYTAYLSCSSQVDPEDSIATTKEEEWVTKKKIELTTTRQIETRVKRQLVLEDGKVVEDSGPMVTTNTTEDTEKQEHSQTEHRTLGDDNTEENWVSVSNPTGRVKEVQEKTVKSREETEERVETEDVQHLGDLSDEGYMTAIKSGSDDFRQALEVSNKKEIVESKPKIIHQSLKTKKFIDTEDKTELSQVQPGGKIINETRITRLHEELGDENISDDEESLNSASVYETSKKENFQKHRKTKEQDITEYLVNGQKIGEKLHYQSETTEGERQGDHFDMSDMNNLSSRLKKIKLRSQNNRLGLENNFPDQQDITSKKSSSYDQEEETRKAETSKWLEYHFGSESTKSSKGSVEDLDDIVPSTQNSFISVTMKSQPLNKSSRPTHFSSSDEDRINTDKHVKNFSFDNENYSSFSTKGSYFQGISQWDARNEGKKFETVNHTDNYQKPFIKQRSYSSFQTKPRNGSNNFHSSTIPSSEIEDRLSPVVELVRRFQPISLTKQDNNVPSLQKFTPYNYEETGTQSPTLFYQFSDHVLNEKNRPSPPLRRKKEIFGVEKELETRIQRDFQKNLSREQEPRANQVTLRSSSPKNEDTTTFYLPPNKKLYQRTRFAANIPPPPSEPRQVSVKQKSKFGESFRKFVGKLRSSSGDRKNKRKVRNHDSRSPSPKENTYQNYNSLDNYGSLMDRSVEEFKEPMAPPRAKFNGNSRTSRGSDKLLQRYYLGEDPFSMSIYGREKEYDENPHKNMTQGNMSNDTDGESDYKSRTLGRFSKSTSRLINPQVQQEVYSYDRGGVQTLPRKFRDERDKSKYVEVSKSTSTMKPNRWKYNKHFLDVDAKDPLHHTGSLINVSIVNQPYATLSASDTTKRPGVALNGPAKPARTYRSNLSRSQSFNIQPEERNLNMRNPYKSNPHLYGLEETPAPLESPSIISNWSQESRFRSQRNEEMKTKDKRKLFMKGLYDRAPELFKTLHGDNLEEVQNPNSKKEGKKYINYSNSFRSTSTVNTNGSNSIDASSSHYSRFSPRDNFVKTSQSPVFKETYHDNNVIKTVSRSENSSNDDYSETVKINSKSDDPLNPSETNTVKVFSKKKIPLKNGHATETIETSETKTIVKSQGLRGGLDNDGTFYNRSPSGVIIKVRNNRN